MDHLRSLCRVGTRHCFRSSIRRLSFLLAAGALAACAPEGGAAPGAPPPLDVTSRRTAADVLEPSIAPEIEITAPVTGPGFGHWAFGMASDGAQRLVLWQSLASGGTTIRATRVAQDGAVLDPLGLDLGAGGSCGADVTFDGSYFLVATCESTGSGWSLRSTQVSPDGSVLAPGEIFVAPPPTGSGSQWVRVASNSAGSLVVWTYGTGEVRRARVGANGQVLDPGGVVTPVSHQSRIGLTPHGAGYLMTWVDETGVLRGARVSAANDLLDPGGFVIEAPAVPGEELHGVQAAFDGVHTWVAWLAWGSSGPSGASIKARRVASDGTLVDPAPIVVYTAASDELIYPRHLAPLGPNMAVMWTRETGPVISESPVVLTRISPAGAVLDPGGIPFAASGDAVYLAPDSAGAFVVWGDRRREPFGYPDTFLAGARLGADGALVDAQPAAITSGGNRQLLPAAAFDGQSYLVAWEDTRVEGGVAQRDIYGARVTPAGEVLDAQGVAIATGQGVHSDPQVVSAGDGSSFVLWSEKKSEYPDFPQAVRAARVNQDGVVLDAMPIEVPLDAALSAGADPGGALVVGESEVDGLVAVRVGNDGAVSSPVTVALDSSWTRAAKATLSFDGSGYFLLWEASDADDASTATFGLHLDVDGTPLDPAWIPVFQGRGFEASAFGGGQHVLLWEEREALADDVWQVRVRAARVTPAGQVLDPQGIVVDEQLVCHEGTSYPVSQAVTYDGSAFMLTWTIPTGTCSASSYERRLAYLDAAGVLGPALTIDEGPRAAALASSGGGALLAYSRFVSDASYPNDRIRARIVQGPVPEQPEPCTGACNDPGDPTEEPPPGGCHAAPAPASSAPLAALALAGLAAAIRRRRRPQA